MTATMLTETEVRSVFLKRKVKKKVGLREEEELKQAQLGVPHSRIQVELGFILQALTCRFSILLRIQDRARVEKNYIWGDTAQKKCILGGADTAHTLLTRVTHGVGTPHNIERW